MTSYYEGNHRTSQPPTAWILHLGGYDGEDLLFLGASCAKNLPREYRAISVGTSPNDCLGRAKYGLTLWVACFTEGMTFSCGISCGPDDGK